nr:u3 small nucleolar rna-associated protein 5 [Quercus suber]
MFVVGEESKDMRGRSSTLTRIHFRHQIFTCSFVLCFPKVLFLSSTSLEARPQTSSLPCQCIGQEAGSASKHAIESTDRIVTSRCRVCYCCCSSPDPADDYCQAPDGANKKVKVDRFFDDILIQLPSSSQHRLHIYLHHPTLPTDLHVASMSSATKRNLRRPADVRAVSPTPASKRQKTAANSHVPTKNGLAFLVDEDARAGKKLTAHLTNGVPQNKAVRVDESTAVVRDQPDSDRDELHQDHISISSGVSDSSEYDSDDQGMEMEKATTAGGALSNGRPAPTQTSTYHEDKEMEDAPAHGEDHDAANAEGEEQEEPTFGDSLRAREIQPIDVSTSLPELAEQSAAIPASSYTALGIPASTSLFTFLTQSLKTNDQEQLERCFQVKDLNSVRATVQRLQSHLVATLLKRIAERIHKRPGRMAQLMVWVQWSLVTHGGYLAGQPDVMKQLRALSQVVRERAAGLQPLLHVKGKLDMLSSQLVARKAVQAASRGLRADEDDDEEAVTYVEGRNDDWSADEAVQSDLEMVESRKSGIQRKSATKSTDISASDEEDEDDEAVVNGISHESDDEDDEDEEGSEADGKASGMFDTEAEETSDDEADEEADEVSDEDEDSDAESEPSELSEEDADLSDTVTAKQVPMKTLNRKR